MHINGYRRDLGVNAVDPESARAWGNRTSDVAPLESRSPASQGQPTPESSPFEQVMRAIADELHVAADQTQGPRSGFLEGLADRFDSIAQQANLVSPDTGQNLSVPPVSPSYAPVEVGSPGVPSSSTASVTDSASPTIPSPPLLGAGSEAGHDHFGRYGFGGLHGSHWQNGLPGLRRGIHGQHGLHGHHGPQGLRDHQSSPGHHGFHDRQGVHGPAGTARPFTHGPDELISRIVEAVNAALTRVQSSSVTAAAGANSVESPAATAPAVTTSSAETAAPLTNSTPSAPLGFDEDTTSTPPVSDIRALLDTQA